MEIDWKKIYICFDDTILLLPKRITDNFITHTVTREIDGTNITNTIKNVAVVQSPDHIEVFKQLQGFCSQ